MLFKKLEFKFTWRSYQQNFLNNFLKHIDDNHLHVIAPPGSGKTILGIEIMKQVGKKILVLSPTLTIRNQWEDRLQSFFVNDAQFDDFSFDLNQPKAITFSTYQSLHSFYKKFENKEDYFNYFKKHKIEVLMLDEAHHLKNEWWKCLFELKERDKLTVIALTATPPYDSDPLEVSKYFRLCGTVDDEIAVPDLVKEGDLCPHQDYVFFSEPNDLEINFIADFRGKIADFIDSLSADEEFIKFIECHRFVMHTNNTLDQIYANPEYFSALLIFLKSVGKEIKFELLEILGFNVKDKIDIPVFDLNWASILLQNLLVTDREILEKNESVLHKLEPQVRKINIFDKSKIDLIGDAVLYRSLSNSPSKLKSIVEIIKHEEDLLKDELRAVVLTDYIKKEFLEIENISSINRLGVMPIFHYLRTQVDKSENLAVLTGTVVVIHHSKIELFSLFDTFENYSFIPLISAPEFVFISSKTAVSKLVDTITKMFEHGYITKLIGTKALLGEGWDAPSINTLVLASFVGSFVSSNQMRGRAIRSQRNNLNKTGNIWHLVCIDKTDLKGGKDIETLRRRFDAFVGISKSEKTYIESGIERLELPEKYIDISITDLNTDALNQSELRSDLSMRWKSAILHGTTLSREIKQYYENDKPYNLQKQQKFHDVVKYSFLELGVGLSFFIPEVLIKNLNVLLSKGIISFVYTVLTAFGLAFGYKTYKVLKNYIQFGFIFKNLSKIGEALKESLIEINLITTKKENIFVKTEVLPKGDMIISIKGTNDFESTIFINAIQEIIEPIKTPRYLILKANLFKKEFDIQNFYSVPQIFGDKKKNCAIFEKNWKQYVGESEFIYTRHLEGRKILLKARLMHLSNSFKKTTKKAVIWN
ncbi:DEAD/DEAH box helicase family protein [Flavobacterium ardleyense]|uniref:DEAD/DEAH box helicase family protein n=1 Tax=Flavobacterium ardleyense TaxID=2038737 RepID=A0ABW5Z718_9FLAO